MEMYDSDKAKPEEAVSGDNATHAVLPLVPASPSYWQLVMMFGGIFLVSGLPFFLSFPSGAAMSGLSSGLAFALERYGWLLFAIGVAMALSAKRTPFILPISFVAMLFMGQLQELIIRAPDDVALRVFMLGALLLLICTASMVRQRLMLAIMAAMMGMGYFVGMNMMQSVQNIAAPLYYMIGTITVTALLLALAMSVAVAVKGQMEDWFR